MALKRQAKRAGVLRRAKRREVRRLREKGENAPGFIPVRYLRLLEPTRRGAAARISLKAESIKLIGRVLRYHQPAAERLITGTAFPQTYADFTRAQVLPIGNSLADELRWNCAVLKRYADRLSGFIALRDRFEAALLTVDLAEAAATLRQIVDRLGQSLWTLRAELLLAQKQGGLKENRAHLADLAEQAGSEFVRVHATLISQRVEEELSASNYESAIDTLCAGVPGSDQPEIKGAISAFRFQFDFSSLRFKPDVRHVLHREASYPMVDRYCCYLRCLQICASDPETHARGALRECIGSLAQAVKDKRLELLNLLANPRSALPATPPDPFLAYVLNAYTSGAHEEAALKAEDVLARGTDAFEFVELYAKSCLYLGREPDGARFGSAEPLVRAVISVLARGPDTTEAVAWLRKLTHTLDGTRFADQVLAFLAVQGCIKTGLDMEVFGALAASAITPRFSEILPPNDKPAFLDKIASWYEHGPVVDLFRDRAPTSFEGIWPPRAEKYEARHAVLRGEYRRAIVHYSALLSHPQGGMPLRHEASLGLCSAYLSAGQPAEAAEITVDAYLERPNGIGAFPIQEIIDACKAHPPTRQDSLVWPILFSIPRQARRRQDSFRSTYAAYDDFLSQAGARKPSELFTRKDSFPARRYIHFLRHVCIPEVMDYSVAFGSSEDLERERIAICQTLLAIDPASSDASSTEIARRTEALVIRRALQRYGESKIHVDTSGIVRSLDRGFYDKFLRFRAFSLLTGRLRETLALKDLRFDTEEPVLVISDATLQQFQDLFDDLRARFISSNEFGLDSYLSVRIRHGTLSGQIRSQFEREALITRKNARTAQYEYNAHWSKPLTLSSPAAVRDKINDAFRRFSATIDGLIQEVKEDWLQIKSRSKAAGMFDFDYTDADAVNLYLAVLQIADVERFVEAVFANLWERTQAQLAKIRDRITGELCQRLLQTIDDLERALGELAPGTRNADLSAALARCRTSVANELGAIAAWFKVGEEEAVPDYKLTLLAYASSEILRNCFPNLAEFPEMEIGDESLMMKGSSFTAFIDLLFILFENAVRHAQLDRPRVQGRIFAHCARLVIEVRNALGPDISVEDLQRTARSLLETAKRATGVIRQEGGSGFAKLHKIAKYDLGQEDYSIDVDVKPKEGFAIRVELSLEGLQT
ncbi:MAG: hypothetical protein WBP56_24290 [Polyangia bacterium]